MVQDDQDLDFASWRAGIEVRLKQLEQQGEKTMATLTDVQTSVTALQAAVGSVSTDIGTAITDIGTLTTEVTSLQAQIANGGVVTSAQLDTVVASLNSITTGLQGTDSTLKAALPASPTA